MISKPEHMLNEELTMAAILENQKILLTEINKIRELFEKRDELEKKCIATTIAEIRTVLAAPSVPNNPKIKPVRGFENIKTHPELMDFEAMKQRGFLLKNGENIYNLLRN